MAPPHGVNADMTAADSLPQVQRPQLDITTKGLIAQSHGKSLAPTGIPSYLVISGGTGCNAICAAFVRACYVLPVSDDGGSSSEIIRVLGGPSIGAISSPSPSASLNGIRIVHR